MFVCGGLDISHVQPIDVSQVVFVGEGFFEVVLGVNEENFLFRTTGGYQVQ